jgi:hypothetical protein
MSFGDILVLVVVGVWLAIVIVSYVRRGKRGCCGCCCECQACRQKRCALQKKKDGPRP